MTTMILQWPLMKTILSLGTCYQCHVMRICRKEAQYHVCTITGPPQYLRDLEQGGQDVPCKLVLSGLSLTLCCWWEAGEMLEFRCLQQ